MTTHGKARQLHLHRVSDESQEHIIVHSKLRIWAARNAYTLIFLSFMFVITWAIMAIIAVTRLGA